MGFKMKGSEFYGKLKLNRNMDNSSKPDGRGKSSSFQKRETGSFIFDVDEGVDKRATYEDTKKAEKEGKRVTYTNRERDRRRDDKDLPSLDIKAKSMPKAHAERLKDPEYKKDQGIDRAAQARLETIEARKKGGKAHKMYEEEIEKRGKRGTEAEKRGRDLAEAESKGADVSKRAATEKVVTRGDDKDSKGLFTARSYSGANTPKEREKRIERGLAARTKGKGWKKGDVKKSAKRAAAAKDEYEDA